MAKNYCPVSLISEIFESLCNKAVGRLENILF